MNSLLQNGLLGMGGLGGITPKPQGLLGNYYDEDAVRKATLKQMLIMGGLGLAGNGWEGAARGAGLAAMETPRQFRDMAMDAYQMDRQSQEDAYRNQQREWEIMDRQNQQVAMNSMDPDIRNLYQMDPVLGREAYRNSNPEMFPQTADAGGGNEVFAGARRGTDGNWYAQTPQGTWKKLEGLPEGVNVLDEFNINRDKAAGTAAGKTAGVAAADLPGARSMANYVKLKIDDIINDPDLPKSIGWTSYLPDAVAPNSVVNFRSKLDEIQGEAFLQARTMLKGGGQITDFESRKAEAAYSAAVRAIQSSDPKGLTDALTRFKEAIDQGIMKLEAQAGQYAPAGQMPQGNGGTTSTGVPWSVE